MMERGQLLLVDGRPAEFLEYQDDRWLSYRHLNETQERWMSASASSVRMRVPRWRDS